MLRIISAALALCGAAAAATGPADSSNAGSLEQLMPELGAAPELGAEARALLEQLVGQLVQAQAGRPEQPHLAAQLRRLAALETERLPEPLPTLPIDIKASHARARALYTSAARQHCEPAAKALARMEHNSYDTDNPYEGDRSVGTFLHDNPYWHEYDPVRHRLMRSPEPDMAETEVQQLSPAMF